MTRAAAARRVAAAVGCWFALAAFGPAPAVPQQAGSQASGAPGGLLADLSDDRIEIRYSFAGARLLLFGAVPPSALGERELVVEVKGPPKPTVVRRKARVAGIWVNKDAMTFETAPGFYFVTSTAPLPRLLTPDLLRRFGLGFDHVPVGPPVKTTIAATPAATAEFRQALIRRKEARDLYRQTVGDIEIVDGGLFRTDVDLPSNVPVGQYDVTVLLVEDGRAVATRHVPLRVDKSGFERAIYTTANERPLFYGIAAVVIALVAGWLAGLVNRQ